MGGSKQFLGLQIFFGIKIIWVDPKYFWDPINFFSNLKFCFDLKSNSSFLLSLALAVQLFSQSISLTQYVVLSACLSYCLSVPVSFWRGFVDNTIVKHCSDIPLIQDIVPSNAGALVFLVAHMFVEPCKETCLHF